MTGSPACVGKWRVQQATGAQDLIARLRGLRMLGCGGMLVNPPEKGSWWAMRHERGLAQERRVVTEAHLAGTTRRDGHAEDECMVHVL